MQYKFNNFAQLFYENLWEGAPTSLFEEDSWVKLSIENMLVNPTKMNLNSAEDTEKVN